MIARLLHRRQNDAAIAFLGRLEVEALAGFEHEPGEAARLGQGQDGLVPDPPGDQRRQRAGFRRPQLLPAGLDLALGVGRETERAEDAPQHVCRYRLRLLVRVLPLDRDAGGPRQIAQRLVHAAQASWRRMTVESGGRTRSNEQGWPWLGSSRVYTAPPLPRFEPP